MASMLIGRRTARRTLATLGFAAIIVTGCATPGAVATPTPAPTRRTDDRAATAPADSGRPPRERVAGRRRARAAARTRSR